MSIPYTTKVNERAISQPISGESHIIGIVGIATYSPGLIRLIEVPQQDDPSTVSIPGYNEITTGTPTGMQFLVNYETGVISFDTAQDGNTVSVSYNGLGSEIAAEDVNELQEPLGTIATQSITYNWPSAPTISWSLAANSVTPASITNSATADFTFPRDVIVARNLITLELTSSSANAASTGVIRLANNSDSISWRNAANSADLALEVNASNQLTFNGSPLGISTLTSAHLFVGNASNIATDTAISGDISITNAGVTSIQPSVVSNAKLVAGTFAAITGIGTQTQALNMNSHLINNVTDPASAQDAATKAYVDAHAGGSPGGSNTQVQFNSSGTFAGDSAFTYVNSGSPNLSVGDGTNAILTFPSAMVLEQIATDQVLFTHTNDAFGISMTLVPMVVAGSRNFDASAVLKCDSTTQGFLPPVMTTTQMAAIGTPTAGLIIYASDTNQFMGYNGGTWVILG